MLPHTSMLPENIYAKTWGNCINITDQHHVKHHHVLLVCYCDSAKGAMHMPQAQEHITALYNVCQQLESSATGKAAETRLQKALDKLHKIQQATLSDTTGLHAKTKHVVNPAQQTAAGSQPAELSAPEGEVSDSMKPALSVRAAEPAGRQPSSGEDAVMADACALNDADPAEDKQEVVSPVKAGDVSTPDLKSMAAAVSKSKMTADKKAQKEEAKVSSSTAVPAKTVTPCILWLGPAVLNHYCAISLF